MTTQTATRPRTETREVAPASTAVVVAVPPASPGGRLVLVGGVLLVLATALAVWALTDLTRARPGGVELKPDGYPSVAVLRLKAERLAWTVERYARLEPTKRWTLTTQVSGVGGSTAGG